MFKAKLIGLLTVILVIFTGIFFKLSLDTRQDNVKLIQEEQIHAQQQLKEKVLLAEESLYEQAQQLAEDDILTDQLKSIREKLSVTPLRELKESTRNTWNKATFDRMTNWLQERESILKQGSKESTDAKDAVRGSVSDVYPIKNWLKAKPDLLLAFAQTPMNDGRLLPVLVANAKKGAELQGGQFYPQYELLNAVAETRVHQTNLINWEKKMYFAVAVPIFSNDVHIATIVLGKELTRELVSMFSDYLPSHQFLMFYYFKPTLRTEAAADEKPTRKYYTAKLSESDQNVIISSKYGKLSENPGQELQYFNTLTTPEMIYRGSYNIGNVKHEVAFSRSTLIWNSAEEVGAYIFSNISAADETMNGMRTRMMLYALLLLIFGCIGVIVIVRSEEKPLREINLALSEYLSTSKPMELDAIKVSGDTEQLVQLLQKLSISGETEEQDENASGIWNQLVSLDEEPEDSGLPQNTGKDEKPSGKAKPEDEYLRPLYEEYTAKRKELHVEEEMDFDRFVRRVHRNEDKIKKTYSCKEVSFEVQVSNGKVVLKPKIVS